MKFAVYEQLLGVAAPWAVTQVSFDPARKSLEVQISYQRGSGWFGARRAWSGGTDRRAWRHLPLGEQRCSIRLERPVDVAVPEAPWSGPQDSPFTHSLGSRLLVLFGNGTSLTGVTAALDLDPQEVWRFKRGLDTGRLGGDWSSRPASEVPAVAASPLPQEISEAASNLPGADNPIWHDLLAGASRVEIRNLGLQLLLTRLRTQYRLASDDSVRSLKAHELRRYCEKNTRAAAHEVEQIRRYAQ